MNSSLRPLLILLLAVLCTAIFDTAKAQKLLRCDQFQTLLEDIAKDSTMKDLKLTEIKDNKYIKSPQFSTSLTITEDDEYSKGDAYIGYNDVGKHNSYYTNFYSMGDMTKEIIAKMKACLGDSWAYSDDANEGGSDTTYYFKNPSNFVVVEIKSPGGMTLIECYKESGNRAPVCVSGDCANYLGSMHFYNGDIYNGTFIDDGLNGPGAIKWNADGTRYEGSFIDGEIAGYGRTLNANGQVTGSGVFFKGALVQIDTSQKTCLQGNCQTGFGLKVIGGGFYVGNFKDGNYNGLGEMVYNKNTYYGYFQNSMPTGKGIYINTKGEYIFGTFNKGALSGNYERDLPDKTSIEADNSSGIGSKFDEDNFLLSSGVWNQGVFTERTDAGYVDLKAFVFSLKEIYQYRQSGYKEIRGAEKAGTMGDKLLLNMGLPPRYNSTKLLLSTFETTIDVDIQRHRYISVSLSQKYPDKMARIALYNKYYDMVSSGVGSRWTLIADDGRAGLKKHECTYTLQNIFDRSKIIKLSFDDKYGVVLEMH